MSHLLDVRLFGLWAGGHHLTSALLHALNTWLAWRVLLQLRVPSLKALLATMLFAWHPMRVESVAWISERKDVLSVCFALLTVLAWLHYRERRTMGRYLVVAVAFVAALASKAMVVTLPGVLAVLDLVQQRGVRPPVRRAVLDKVPLLLASAAVTLAVVRRQHALGAVDSGQTLGLGERLAGVPWAISRYLEKTLWPVDLCVMYPRMPIETWQWALGLLVVAAVTVGLLVLARGGRPEPLVGWALFLITLVPVSGLMQAGAQLIADRYSYLGHLALFTGLTLAIPDSWLMGRARQTLLVLVPLLLFGRTLVQVQTWRDSTALFARALEVEPNNPPIQMRLEGLAVEEFLAQGKLAEAQLAAAELIAKHPMDEHMWILAGTASARSGAYAEAIERFKRALALNPDSEDAARFLSYAEADARQAH